jgi:hypothetical protein
VQFVSRKKVSQPVIKVLCLSSIIAFWEIAAMLFYHYWLITRNIYKWDRRKKLLYTAVKYYPLQIGLFFYWQYKFMLSGTYFVSQKWQRAWVDAKRLSTNTHCDDDNSVKFLIFTFICLYIGWLESLMTNIPRRTISWWQWLWWWWWCQGMRP